VPHEIIFYAKVRGEFDSCFGEKDEEGDSTRWKGTKADLSPFLALHSSTSAGKDFAQMLGTFLLTLFVGVEVS